MSYKNKASYRLDVSSLDILGEKRHYLPLEIDLYLAPEDLTGYLALERVNGDLLYMHLSAWYAIFGSKDEKQMKLIDRDYYDFFLLRVI